MTKENLKLPYFGGVFGDEESVFNEFCVSDAEREGVKIKIAIYEQESYEGTALVIFKKDGKFYAVKAGHCSCNGLEEGWCPVEVTRDSLLLETEKGNLGMYHTDKETLTALIKKLR